MKRTDDFKKEVSNSWGIYLFINVFVSDIIRHIGNLTNGRILGYNEHVDVYLSSMSPHRCSV